MSYEEMMNFHREQFAREPDPIEKLKGELEEARTVIQKLENSILNAYNLPNGRTPEMKEAVVAASEWRNRWA